MRRMAGLGIGANLIVLLGYASAMATTASGSVQMPDWSITLAVEEPTCFEMRMPDSDWTIIGYSPHGGYPLLSAIDCTELSSLVIMLGSNAQPNE